MEKAKEFYINILELEISYEAPPEFGWLEFKLPVKGSFLGLGKHNEEQQGPFKSVNVLNISVSDLKQAKKALESKGIETSDYLDIPDMISMFHIKDPDENDISFIGTPRVKSK
jgi:predicted enzyme related to lactoylglutathione lyase